MWCNDIIVSVITLFISVVVITSIENEHNDILLINK